MIEKFGYGKTTLVKRVYDRRKFVGDFTKLGLGVLAGTELLSSCNFDKSNKNFTRVGILGAGISGLHAGLIFSKNNIDFKLFEASKQPGGRIFTLYDSLGEGVISEMGGEFIDSNHTDMISLTKEFGLELNDINAHIQSNNLIKDSFYFNRKHFTEEQVISEFKKYSPSILADIKSLESEDPSLLYRFDKLSINEYLVYKNIDGWFFDLLTNAFTAEYGAESSVQSSLNLLTMLDATTSRGLRLYGESDERFKIRGGNKLLVQKMAKKLDGKVLYDHFCTEISMRDGLYEINFNNSETYYCEYLLVTIPFTALRKIALNFDIPETKRRVINLLSYGTNSKLSLGFKNAPWLTAKRSGYLFSNYIQNGWDTNLTYTNATSSAFTIFLGGEAGRRLTDSQSDSYLKELDTIFQGCKNEFINKKLLFNWTNSSLSEGSYAVYKVGEWASFAGLESVPVGNMFFAGEHCSEDFRGYMNGGAETGRLTAEEIIKRIQRV
jgi:monoamine oxidase